MSRARYALLPSRAVADPDLTDTEFRLLAAIGTFLDEDFECWPSQETLADMTGKSRSTIIRTLKLLEEKAYIVSRKKYPNRPGTHKCYAVLMDGELSRSDTSESSTGDTSGSSTQDATSGSRTQDATSHRNDPVERPNGTVSSDQKKSMSASQLRDAIWKAAPDKSRKRSSLKLLYAACEKAIDRLPGEKILAAWQGYLDSPDAKRDGGEYVPAVDRWIKQGKYDAWVPADVDPQADLLTGVYGARFYSDDAIPWCGLWMAAMALKAGKPVPRLFLAAREWAGWGNAVMGAPKLGDVLVFARKGGGHVGLYVGEDETAFHVLGGNQSDQVCVTRIWKERLLAARNHYSIGQPSNCRRVFLSADGTLSTNEA